MRGRLNLVSGAAAIGLAVAAVGCGGSAAKPAATPASVSDAGVELFVQAGCGSCHTLAAARAGGQIGPNLDQLKPDAATVARQVRSGGGAMPSFRDQLSSKQIDDLAAYVARVAGTKGTRGMPDSVAATFRPTSTKVSQCGTDTLCYQQAFGNLAYREGSQRALAAFARAIKTNPTVGSGCHLIAHAIGAGALVRYKGDPGKAFVAGGNLAMTCWSGYYHGILQRAFLGVPRTKASLQAAARRLCSSAAVHTNSFVLYQCVHGLGHGLMIYTAYDLPLALRICDGLATAWDQSSCTGGVFMENLQSSLGIASPWLKKSDPLYPCDIVAQRDKLYCYLMVTSHVLDVSGGSWQKTAQWCRRAETGWTATCFQSFGRDASGRTRQDPVQIVRLCALARDLERDCIYGAARDITSMDAGARRASPFCSRVPASFRATCFNGIGTILGGFHTSAADRRAACRASVPRAYRRDCFAGAGA
jgi:mono/diheme cytochrome c family protein